MNAGDAISIQCDGRIIIFEKNGELRASLEAAGHLESARPEFDDAVPF